ncbi:glycosyltransferase family 2 protein [Flavobacterium amnicola]|uniref:Glycosyltransferase family 2 protein n=1 Tax=Flavobacterium amnicola TaxID=2506422 RepID=A0A4V1N1S3_9FLAO|nr:glycosyltransferase family A protein [Flavobacterium amnicola]RXR17755.1 glycosyltransferase family 2 protein [Flavobacterium amnicola]
MQNPLVTVVIPTYKRTDYLKLTLESILNQSFQDFEIIVVDDGTPNDDNLMLCSSLDKVYYIKIDNTGGPAKPRNVGIENAKGKYIAFVDDDDLWTPEKLQKQVDILDENPDFGLVHTYCQVIDAAGMLKDEFVGKPGSPNVKHGDVFMRMMGNWTIMMPTPIVRKEIIDKVGGFNETIPGTFADVEYWVKTSFYTQFYYIDEPLVLYRVHDQNMSNDTLKYLQLPLCLKKVLQQQFVNNKITKKQYAQLLNNLCQMQISTVKMSILKTIKSLYLLDFFWLFKTNNCKMLIYVLFFKK